MKKLMLILAAILLALPMVAKEKYSRNPSDLPAEAQSLIQKEFPNNAVSHIKIETDWKGEKDYDVILDNGVEIEFDAKGEWEDIDCGHNAVPSALVPNGIKAFVSANHNGQIIVKIDKKHNYYEVELANGIELLFDKSGKFSRYDN